LEQNYRQHLEQEVLLVLSAQVRRVLKAEPRLAQVRMGLVKLRLRFRKQICQFAETGKYQLPVVRRATPSAVARSHLDPAAAASEAEAPLLTATQPLFYLSAPRL
jgi:hypothetical protein